MQIYEGHFAPPGSVTLPATVEFDLDQCSAWPRLFSYDRQRSFRNPIEVDISLHPDLKASIEATMKSSQVTSMTTFLVTQYGKPYTATGFGNAMRDWCDQAGLHHCSAHGLRKATLTQMANAGATPHELKAVSGHQTLTQVANYTKATRNSGLADSAFEKWTKMAT